jgi:DNA-binding NarL/FixJ family response regulator
VHRLVLRREVTVVLTLRSGELAPDAVTDLWKDGHLRRLEIGPLSLEETAALLEGALGGPMGGAAARDLWTITRGNALYLQQLVDGELDAGRLAQVGGVWRWSGRPQLTPGLAELVQARIGRLSDAQRDVVEVLAFGEPLGVALLAGLTDADAVERVEARGLIEVHTDGRRVQARLAHPLYGELQRARCGQLRARRLRGRIAIALADTGCRRADDTLRLATLTLDSDFEADAEVLTAAAGRAVQLCNPALAERLALAAAAAGGGFEARFIRCEALLEQGRTAEGFSELALLSTLAADDIERTRAANIRASTLFWRLARPAEAQAVLAAACDAVQDGGCLLLLASLRSLMDAVLGRAVEAAATAAEVLASPTPLHPMALTVACWSLATAHAGLGRLDGLDEALRQVDAVTDQFEPGYLRIAGIGNARTRAQRLAGMLTGAEHEAQGYLDRFQAAGGFARPVSRVVFALVALDQGRVRTAVRWFRETGAELTGHELSWSYVSAMGLATALGMAGDAIGARHARTDMEAQRHPCLVFREPDLILARAWVAAAEGAVGEAIVLARQAAEVAASQTQPAVEVVALHAAVCFGDRTVAGRLAELATRVDGPRAPAAAAHAAALAADDADALQAASVQLEDMGALLLAADAAAHAAAAHTRQGGRGAAQTGGARAHRLAAACEGARTPALLAIDAPTELTGREREIVALAAGGLSNKAIAERLVVSVRTVEGHLFRACAKLGTSDRTKFAALLRGD